jgi:hypothetical protein
MSPWILIGFFPVIFSQNAPWKIECQTVVLPVAQVTGEGKMAFH